MSWRDHILVHPAADLFPMMSDAELEELAKDIVKAKGLTSPIILWGGLDSPLLLDGRNRLAAIARIGGDQEATLRAGYLLDEGTDPYAYVVSANIHRRHLTAEGKREVIAKLLKADPKTSDLTDRQIARIIGCGHPLVAEVRKTNGIIFHKTERVEASGRKARGRKPGTAASPKPIAVSDVDPTEREPDPSINKSQHVQRMVDTLDPVERFDLASNLLLSMTPARLQEIASSAFNLLPDKRRAVMAERWWGPAEMPMKFHPVNGPTAKQMSAWIEPSGHGRCIHRKARRK
jgi:hypothetical protein